MKKKDFDDNYRMLMVAIIEQACQDYSSILMHNEKVKKNGCYRDLINSKHTSAYIFLSDPNNIYLNFLELDGMSLIHKIEKNVKSYGKGIPTTKEWEQIKKMEELE